MHLRNMLRAIYPPGCVSCSALVAEEGALCAACWRETGFIQGLVCDQCGSPLPGEDDGTTVLCDDCLTIARPWARGRAAMLYGDNARKIVLGLKYYDRLDLARPAGRWLAQAAAPLLTPDTLIAPVPLHWLRLLKRRYNQAALLSQALARETGLDHCPDLMLRRRSTGTQEGRGRDGRFANLEGAFALHSKRGHRAQGRPVLLVDDVMTSGATFASAADTCLAGGARSVNVVALARVARGV